MKITNTEVKNVGEFYFVCQSWETRNCWGHLVTLNDGNGYQVATDKRTYYNRTWESYRYQSTMVGATKIAIENRQESLKNIYKEEQGIARLTSKHKDKLQEIFDKDWGLQELTKLLAKL